MLKNKYSMLVVLGILSALLVCTGFNSLAASSKITVGVGGWAVEDTKRAVEELKFTEKTGIEVEVVTRPGAPPEFLSQMTSAIMAGTSPYDVIDIEDEAAISFSRAGWLEDLNALFDETFWEDWTPDMVEMVDTWHRYKGSLFRIPHNFEAQYFWYRKDLFDQMGVTPPTTWDEMVEIGKKLTKDGMWGVSDGLVMGGFLGVYIAYLTKQAGGSPYEFGEPLRVALQFIHDMMYKHKIFPVAALNKNYDAVNLDYMNDRVAMMRQWPFFYDVSRGKPDWFEEDKVVIALPPKGPDNGQSWAASWGWVIPKTASNKEAAKEFVKFMTSTENAPKLARMSTWWLNSRRSVLNAMGDEGMAPYLRMYSEAGVIGTRPSHPRFMEAKTVVEELASAYLTNQISLDEVVRRGKEKMKALGSSS